MKIGAAFGFLWALFDLAIGGIDTPIKALAVLMILDFITGVTAGYKTHSLSSVKGSRGILKKIGVLFCIILAYVLDCALAIHMFRGMVISGFAIIEVLSIVENIDRMGYGFIIPDFLRFKLMQVVQEKHISKGDEET
nr:phage holin family protein [Pectinatus frisingensis]